MTDYARLLRTDPQQSAFLRRVNRQTRASHAKCKWAQIQCQRDSKKNGALSRMPVHERLVSLVTGAPEQGIWLSKAISMQTAADAGVGRAPAGIVGGRRAAAFGSAAENVVAAADHAEGQRRPTTCWLTVGMIAVLVYVVGLTLPDSRAQDAGTIPDLQTPLVKPPATMTPSYANPARLAIPAASCRGLRLVLRFTHGRYPTGAFRTLCFGTREL